MNVEEQEAQPADLERRVVGQPVQERRGERLITSAVRQKPTRRLDAQREAEMRRAGADRPDEEHIETPSTTTWCPIAQT